MQVGPKKYRFHTPDAEADVTPADDKTIAKVSLPAKLEKALMEEILKHKNSSRDFGIASRKMSAKKLTVSSQVFVFANTGQIWLIVIWDLCPDYANSKYY